MTSFSSENFRRDEGASRKVGRRRSSSKARDDANTAIQRAWMPKILKRLSSRSSRGSISEHDREMVRRSIGRCSASSASLRFGGSFQRYFAEPSLMSQQRNEPDGEGNQTAAPVFDIYNGSNASEEWKDFIFGSDEQDLFEDNEETEKWQGVIQT